MGCSRVNRHDCIDEQGLSVEWPFVVYCCHLWGTMALWDFEDSGMGFIRPTENDRRLILNQSVR